MNILIVGATGLLGGKICTGLVRQGHRVRGLVRHGSPREAGLQQAGVEVFHGDLTNPTSLDAACQGMNVVVSTATAIISAGAGNSLAATDRDGHLALVAAARKNQLQKFVYVSVSPVLPATIPLIACKRETEQAVRASGLNWTILQPSCFMEIWFGPVLGWKLPEGEGRIFGAGTAPISYISIEDVAAYAVASVTPGKSDRQDVPLGGPEAISTVAALRVFEQVLGRKFKVQRIPGFVPRIGSTVLRPFNPKVASLMGLMVHAMRGDPIDLAKARQLYALPATSVAEFAKRQIPS